MKFNSLLTLLLFLNISFNINAQETTPQKVYSLVKVQHDFNWYTDQYDLWEKELQKKPKNADGWLSFYTAARMAKIFSRDKETKDKWLKNMDLVVEKMERKIKGSYEYHYIRGYHLSTQNEHMTDIMKAYEINPHRADTYDELVTHYEITRNKEGLKAIAKKWAKTDDISPTHMLWNYNMLASTSQNAILLTAGDMDTYPSLILQYAEDFRTDVTVINTSLILLEDYRNKLFEELSIPRISEEVYQSDTVVAHIIKHLGERPLFVAISCQNSSGIDNDKLYNAGLAMQYSEDGNLDHTSLLVKNFEQNILLDHLQYMGYNEPFELQTKQFNFVYVPGLLMLHRHYSIIGNITKKNKIKKLILNIIANSEQETSIKEALKKNAKC
jgi:hypothetical protein